METFGRKIDLIMTAKTISKISIIKSSLSSQHALEGILGFACVRKANKRLTFFSSTEQLNLETDEYEI